MATYDELLKEYKTLSMRADKRMQRIEQYAKEPGYKGMLNFSYARAMRDIKAYSGQGGTRWGTKPPASKSQLQAKINDMKAFLESPSSTKRGITSVYKQRVKTFNAHYGTDFTWQEYGAFFESAEWDKIKNEFRYSDTVVKAIASIKKAGKDIDPKDIIGANAKNIILDKEDDIVDEIAKMLLKRGFSYLKMFM